MKIILLGILFMLSACMPNTDVEINSSSDSEQISLGDESLRITKGGSYILTGTMNDEMVIVDAGDEKVELILDNVSITNNNASAIYIKTAKQVDITLKEGTTNYLSCSGEDENNIDGTIFSKEDVTFKGSGSLVIESTYGHGIVSKDDLVISEGVYTITSSGHGIQVNNIIELENVDMNITSSQDGIQASHDEDETLGNIIISGGIYTIVSEGDGISASNSLDIHNGTFDICSGGGSVNGIKQTTNHFHRGPVQTTEDTESTKGIKSGGPLTIHSGSFKMDSCDDAIHSNDVICLNGGTFEIKSGDDGIHGDLEITIQDGVYDILESYEGIEALEIEIVKGTITIHATDDGLNAAGGMDSSGSYFGSSNGKITIQGGNITINASGDGIDSNGTLEINGGYCVVCGPTKGDTSVLDYDKTATISGGTFIGAGANMMAQTFSDSTQGVISLSVGNQSASSVIKVCDLNGNQLISYTPSLDYQIVIVSCEEMVKGEQYEITIGQYSDIFSAH